MSIHTPLDFEMSDGVDRFKTCASRETTRRQTTTDGKYERTIEPLSPTEKLLTEIDELDRTEGLGKDIRELFG